MDQALTPLAALDLAVTRAGSQSALARVCGVSQPAVWRWLSEAKQLPAEHVLDVEKATGVSRHDLRPDIYPRGLQDGVPYSPPANVGGEFGDVADEKQPKLQPAPDDPEWPVRAAS